MLFPFLQNADEREVNFIELKRYERKLERARAKCSYWFKRFSNNTKDLIAKREFYARCEQCTELHKHVDFLG